MERRKTIASGLAAIILVAACGGSSSGPAGPGGAGDGASFAAQVTITQDDERVPVPLQGGRYRLGWSVDGCPKPHIVVSPAEGGEPIFENPAPNIRIIFVNEVPAGLYFIDQTEPSCTGWELVLDRVGN